jgi:hypothetical protein
MPPAKDIADQVAGGNKPFHAEASSVVVAFHVAASGRDHDHNHERDRETLRMSFKACYDPPVVTFRFNVSVFGYGSGKKKEKTTLYFDVPRQHISLLEQADHVDTATVPELDRNEISKLEGSITRVRFLLNRPGNLVQPIEERSLKPASQRTLASMTLLATAFEFAVFMPHTTLSQKQIQCLQQAVISSTTLDDQQQQEKEYGWWLKALYGGAGGQLLSANAATVSTTAIDSGDTSTASESGDSTVAMATPPAYKRSMVPGDQDSAIVETTDEITAASPPSYESLKFQSEDRVSTVEITGVYISISGKRCCLSYHPVR